MSGCSDSAVISGIIQVQLQLLMLFYIYIYTYELLKSEQDPDLELRQFHNTNIFEHSLLIYFHFIDYFVHINICNFPLIMFYQKNWQSTVMLHIKDDISNKFRNKV